MTNIHLSYDYEDLLKDIKNEIAIGNINLNSTIQVLRKYSPTLLDNYYPIVDWYYEHEIQIKDLQPDPLDHMFPEDDFFYGDEIEAEEKELLEQRHQYEKNRPHLTTMIVKYVIAEMEYWNTIIKKD